MDLGTEELAALQFLCRPHRKVWLLTDYNTGFEGSHYQILDALPQLLCLLTVIRWGFQAFMEFTLQPLVGKEVQSMLLMSSGAVRQR